MPQLTRRSLGAVLTGCGLLPGHNRGRAARPPNQTCPIDGLSAAGLDRGRLYIGESGADPELRPQACFWDAGGTIPARQPIWIEGGSPMRQGTPARLFTASTYSVRLRDDTGAQIFYDANAASGADASTNVFVSAAAAATSRVPARFQITGVQTLGYAAPGDGGEATYLYSATEPSHPGKFRSLDGAWWELQPAHLGVNVRTLGAKGDGATDDTTAFANAILVARAKPCLTVYAPAGAYQLTASLDFTYARAGENNLKLIGDGSGQTTFDFSQMGEPYPAIDFTGNGSGVARGWTALVKGDACRATTLFLAAKNALEFSGNGVIADDIRCYLPTRGYNPNNHVAAVFASVDRSQIRNSYFNGPRGLQCSGYRPAVVASKFQHHNAQVDWTEVELTSVEAIGSVGPALRTSGSLKLGGINYFALVANPGGSVYDAIVELSTEGHVSPRGHEMQGFIRTENQSRRPGVCAIKLTMPCRGWNLWGQLETDKAGYVFGGEGRINGSNLMIDSADAPLFQVGCGGSMLNITTSSIHNPGEPAAGCFGWKITGSGMSPAQLAAAGVRRWELLRTDGTWRSSADEVILGPKSLTPLRPGGFHRRWTFGTNYDHPGAERLMASFEIPAGLIGDDRLVGGALGPGYQFIMDFGVASAAAKGRLRIEVKQGQHAHNLLDTGYAAPAGTLVGEFTGRIFSLSGDAGIYGKGKAEIGGLGLFQNYVNLGAFGIVGAEPSTINVYWTNPSAHSFHIEQIEARWI